MSEHRRILSLGAPALALVLGIGIGISGRDRLEQGLAESGSVVEATLSDTASGGPAESAAPTVPDVPVEGRVAELDDPLPHWITQTRAERWPDRWDAVNELGIAGDARGIQALVHVALHDDNPHPRWRSLWAIGMIDDGASRARPLLVEPLEASDASDRLRYNAAVALGFFGDAAGVALLQEALQQEDSFQRWEAVYTLGILRDTGSAAVLAQRLDHETESNVRIRGETALVLGRIAAPDAASQLLRVLANDPAHEVRWRAALALQSVGSAEHEPALRQRLAEEDHPEVREWIAKVIDAVTD